MSSAAREARVAYRPGCRVAYEGPDPPLPVMEAVLRDATYLSYCRNYPRPVTSITWPRRQKRLSRADEATSLSCWVVSTSARDCVI